MSRHVQRRLWPALIALIALAVTIAAGGSASAAGNGKGHGKVKSKTDDAVAAKLSPELAKDVSDNSTATVRIVATMKKDAVAQAASLLTNEHVASRNDLALMIGSITATKLPKLASLAGVGSVEQIDFKQTGSPDSSPIGGGSRPSLRDRQNQARHNRNRSVPYDKAPPGMKTMSELAFGLHEDYERLAKTDEAEAEAPAETEDKAAH